MKHNDILKIGQYTLYMVTFLFMVSALFAETLESRITVDCASTHRHVSYVGFLHGLYGADDAAIIRLRPNYWRAPILDNIHRIARVGGIDVSVLMEFTSDCNKSGSNPRIINQNTAKEYADFIRFRYNLFTEEAGKYKYRIKYWEFINEGEGRYIWEPRKRGENVNKTERLFYAFKIFHDTIRELEPNALIVAPSLNHYRPNLIEDFLRRCTEQGVTFHALSWHVIDHRPEDIPAQVELVRKLIKKYPLVGVKEIHLNEWGWPNIGTGSQMSYFYYMEKAQVDIASKSIWSVEPLDNLYTPDGHGLGRNVKPYQEGSSPLPRVSYWAWEFYANMGPKGYAVQTDDPYVVCLAAKDREDPSVLRLIVARASQTRLYTSSPKEKPARTCPLMRPAIDLLLLLTNLEDGEVEVETVILPNNDWAMTEEVRNTFISKTTESVTSGKLKISLQRIEEEMSFLITIRRK